MNKRFSMFIGLLLVGMLKANFNDAKTFFQTNAYYDARIAIPVDAVVIHPHNDMHSHAMQMQDSWKRLSVPLGRMFFADSDDSNEYWTGLWDGKKHTDEVETLADGTLQLCAGVRPYMLATPGWTRYLESKVDISLNNGIDAVLPEEPLAHVFSGYEDAFKKAWSEYYKTPWQPENKNIYARYRTAALKSKLYFDLEKDILEHTKQRAEELIRSIDFIVPIHSLYSNVSAGLVAPLGTSLDIEGVDGYIGQIWTGPVNWCLQNYRSDNKSFFASAYALYDYFVQLTVGTPKKLWLLVDPVEDDPNHQWQEFEQWYKHCVTAMLLMRDTERYEVLPWPSRIFLPGHQTGGGTPAPVHFRRLVLSITQALQDMPLGGQWLGGMNDYGIGIAVSDSLMWQRKEGAKVQGIYAMILPLLQEGVQVSSAVMERAEDSEYMSRFKVLVLSYEDWKPYRKQIQDGIVKWVQQGGVLVVLGADGDELDKVEDFWWQKEGYNSALSALLHELDYKINASAPKEFGQGWVLREKRSPSEFSKSKIASEIYLPLICQALEKTGINEFQPTGYFAMKRGDYVIAHSIREDFRMKGCFVDIFDDNLAVIDEIFLKKGQSGIYRDVSEKIKSNVPSVLQTSYRLIDQDDTEGQLRFIVKGPEENTCVARLFPAGYKIQKVEGIAGDQEIEVCYEQENGTIKVTFPNHAEGVGVTVHWVKES